MSSNKAVELKGGMYTFMSLRVRSSDLDAIDAALADKVHQAPAFFKDTPIVVDIADLEALERADGDAEKQLNAGGLLECIRRHKLQPIVVSSSNKSSRLAMSIALPLIEVEARRRVPGQQATGAADGVVDKSTDKANKSESAEREDKPGTAADKAAEGPAQNDEPTPDVRPDADRTATPLATASTPAGEIEYVVKSPLLVDKPVRSGQQIYARDTDLIIMGQVGPGAEVIADNNIHVYGPLRGRALCGVSGNTDARIFCQSLEAELVSVAGTYRMLETIPEDLRGRPAQIWLDNDRLNIEPL